MVEVIANPPFTLYVVSHPEYCLGKRVANLLLDHFGSHRYRNVAGGASVRVIFRNTMAPGSQVPLSIDWDSSDTTAAVILLDGKLVRDPTWVQYVRDLAAEAEDRGYSARLIPVSMEEGTLVEIDLEENAPQWHAWTGTDEERGQRLVRDLTYEFSRMLRHHLTQLQHPSDGDIGLRQYLEKVQVFLSHSKHDNYGERVASEIRGWLLSDTALAVFLDVTDIPAGVSFESVINLAIGDGVMVAIYTDSYSSREWCRREVIRAKRVNVPMLLVDCLQTVDERSFPYLGNVPFLRIDPDTMDRLDQIASCLLDEVFKDFLWRCRVEGLRCSNPQTLFLAHAPELASLTSLPEGPDGTERNIVYPYPPLGAEEVQLFSDVAQDVKLYSLTQWLAEKTK